MYLNPKCLIRYRFLLKLQKNYQQIYQKQKQLPKGFSSWSLMKFIPSWGTGHWLKIYVKSFILLSFLFNTAAHSDLNKIEHLYLLFCEILDCCPCIHTFCPNYFSSECSCKNHFPSPPPCWLCQFFCVTPLTSPVLLHYCWSLTVLSGMPRFIQYLSIIFVMLTPVLLTTFAKLNCTIINFQTSILLLYSWLPLVWEEFFSKVNKIRTLSAFRVSLKHFSSYEVFENWGA